MSEWVSFREYARRRQCSEAAVRKAIREGKIDKAIDYTNPKRPKINPILADMEWAEHLNPNYSRNNALAKRIQATAEAFKDKEVSPENIEKYAQQRMEEADDGQLKGSGLAQLKRKHAEVKLQQDAIKLAEQKAILVKKDAVYRNLFAMGQEMRTKLQSIPDRHIDAILAARTRNESHQILFDAISDALEALSEMGKRDIAKR